jgi:hypothetical protein
MASLTETQRSQLDRYDLQETRTRLNRATPRQERVYAVLSVGFIAVLAALTYAAFEVFDGWHHLIVLADMAIVFLGIAAWNNPRRRNA